MNPLFIGAIVAGLAWIITRRQAESSDTTVLRNAAPSGGSTNVYPLSLPVLQAAPSRAAHRTATRNPNVGFAPSPVKEIPAATPEKRLSADLIQNVPPDRDIAKAIAQIADRDCLDSLAAGKSGCGGSCGSGGGCGGSSHGTKKKKRCDSAVMPDNRFTDGTSCLAGDSAMQSRELENCKPGIMRRLVRNLLSSSGVPVENECTIVQTPTGVKGVTPSQLMFRGGNAAEYFQTYARGILGRENNAILGGEGADVAFDFATQQMRALSAYSQISNWDWVNNRAADPSKAYTSPSMADNAIASGSGVPGISFGSRGPWGGADGWQMPNAAPAAPPTAPGTGAA